jgi:putative IMPACT (imprinted ancient) family translation regulator
MKSVFTGVVVEVENEADARSAVRSLRQQDTKARHMPFAFRVGENPVKEGMSDDREPRGAAGLPMLALLRHRDDRGILVAVYRRFGGIKCGPGNLRRAYTEAARLALETAGGL